MKDDKDLPSSPMTAMMNVFIVVDLKVVKSYEIFCDLFRVDFDLIWSCVSQVWCCYDNAKPEMFASLDSHWGLSWGVHVTVPKGKHGKTDEKLTICISCWQFERSLQESPDPDPIDPDHPWPSVTIPNHPFTNHLWHLQDAVVKQGLCIMSRARLKFPLCSAFVPWLHVHCLITEFWKAVILICNTFLQYAWFCNWDAPNGFFETLARLIPIFTDGLWYVKSFQLFFANFAMMAPTIWQASQSDKHRGATRGVRECTKLREVRK